MEEHGYAFATDINGILTTPASARRHPRATAHRLPSLLYADDMSLLSSSKASLAALLARLEVVSTEWGLSINYAKTKAMHIHPLSTPRNGPPACPSPIQLAGGNIEFVQDFVYLGSRFSADGSLGPELARRMGAARGAFGQLGKLWEKHDVSLPIRMMVFKAIIPPTLLYGCETWALSAAQTRQLDVFLNECLRKVLGTSRGEHAMSNEELRQLCRQQDVASMVRKYRLRFLGHVARQDNTRYTKQMLFATHIPGVTARPKWGGEFITGTYRDDLMAIEEHNNWFEHAQDREDWRHMLHEKFGPQAED